MHLENLFRNLIRRAGLGLICSCLAYTPSFAADVYLVASEFVKTMPDGAQVPMWGFASDADSDLSTAGGEAATAPGPLITVPAGDTVLNIHLRNDLEVPVSIVIPGQKAALAPVRFTDAQGRQRVQSFTAETAPGGTNTYTWTNFSPGTYMYQSGTHPAVQVQMGLYGAVKKDSSTGAAYANVPYDTEVTLIYSEVDPVLHEAVTSGGYGTAAYPGTNAYNPRYFLVNGEADYGQTPIAAGQINGKVLIRLINAGLESHVPMFQNNHVEVIAEDGKPYSHAKDQYTVHMPAGKTKDVIFSATQEGVYPVYDRRLFVSGAQGPTGGLLAYLNISTEAGAPVASNDNYGIEEDGALTIAAPGILSNDSGSGDPLTAVLAENVKNGTLALNGDGSFVYTPAPDFNGNDFFVYRASDGSLESNTASVVIAVAPVNDAPAAVDDAVSTIEGTEVMIPVLENDTDPDGDQLLLASYSNAANGAVSVHMDHFAYMPADGFTGTDQFQYTMTDGTLESEPATVTITVNPVPNQAPVAVDDYATTKRNVAVVINVIANDSDTDGSIAPGTVVIVTSPTRGGTVAVNANGTVTYTPFRNFRGTDVFTYTVKDNKGAVSNIARVRVNVVL